jgi:hypothetical protein
MKRVLMVALVGVLFSVPAYAAASQSKANDAIECSAVYLIASSLTAGNAEAAEQMMLSQMLFDRVFAAIEGKRLNRAITNGDISKNKSIYATMLGLRYDSDHANVYKLEMRCNAWRVQIGIHLNEKMGAASDADAVQAIMRTVPSIPQTPQSTDPRWERSKVFVDNAFAAWTKLGRVTPMSAKQQIQSAKSTNTAKPISIKVIEAVAAQLRKCWIVPAGAKDEGNLIISIRVEMNPDATVRSSAIVDVVDVEGSVSSSFSRASAQSALRATENPRCQPLPLPLDQYEQWKVITLNFNPQDML